MTLLKGKEREQYEYLNTISSEAKFSMVCDLMIYMTKLYRRAHPYVVNWQLIP